MKTNLNTASSTITSNESNGNNHRASPFIVEDTSSSSISFQSTSDTQSIAGSLVESPTKSEPIELNPSFNPATSLLGTVPSTTETVTMTLEEISQFAQNIY